MDVKILLKRAKEGDKDALVELIMEQKEQYYKLAYVYMKNPEDSLDAISDMIVILYDNIHKLKKENSFYSWSKTILVNCCKNILRKNKRIISLDNIREEIDEDAFEKKDDQIILEKHLTKLNNKHEEAIRLHYFLDLDYKSIAEIIKVPIGTVKSRISIGLKKLKESLGGESL